MSTYVLVHGSWHGGWCWYKVVARLQAAGHTVFAPDLPCLGADKTPVGEATLDLWNASVCDLLDRLDEPAILVGHSRGGLLISAAAEARPQKVSKLVYLCAIMLRDGEHVFGAVAADGDDKLSQFLQIDETRGYATVADEGIRETFYGGCSDDDVALAKLLLQPEPLAPLNTPVQLSEANYGSVPRVYIECTQDRAISINAQRGMCEHTRCEVISMDTDHSPFFSAPDELTAHLLGL